MQEVKKTGIALDSLIIFPNDDDVLNLVELLSLCSLLISPSTGTIHIASNLNIPTIGLYEQKDTIQWGTRDKNYVILRDTKENLHLTQCRPIIDEILQNLRNLIANNALQMLKIDKC